MNEHCVFCGQEIQEGRQLCQSCEKNVERAISMHASAGMTYAEAEGRIKAVANMISGLSSSTVFSFNEVLSMVERITREALNWKATTPGYNVVDMACEKIKHSIRASVASDGRKKHE